MNGFLNSLAARFHAMSRQELTDPGCFLADLQQTYTYKDWTAWSTTQEHLSAEALVFWETYLDHPPLQTGLNQSRRPRSCTGGFESWTLPRDLSKSLLHACTDLFVSPHQLMLTAVALATQALRPSQDIVMMAPYSLRTEPLTEVLAGCLLDRVPIRVKWDRSQSLLELLRAVQQSSQAVIAHAVPYWLPYQTIVNVVINLVFSNHVFIVIALPLDAWTPVSETRTNSLANWEDHRNETVHKI
ncbi:hypothetical protein CBS147346_282 [Aspergillus niger]|nr:hypothetical protein CBS147346_282 [Aspergillus niger]